MAQSADMTVTSVIIQVISHHIVKPMSQCESHQSAYHFPHVSIFWSATRTPYISVPSQRQYSTVASVISSRDPYTIIVHAMSTRPERLLRPLQL
jgi:hypothetical protein